MSSHLEKRNVRHYITIIQNEHMNKEGQLTQQTGNQLTKRIVFCVSYDLDESLRERAWEERKSVSQLVREYCEIGLNSKSSQN